LPLSTRTGRGRDHLPSSVTTHWSNCPLFFASHGLAIDRIGVVKAVYPAVWGLLQVATGSLSDRWGRKGLIAWGMIVQAAGIWLTVLVPSYAAWILGAVLQGLGTAMVYPTLLAASSTMPNPRGGPRASASTGFGATWATR
jgi:MFS family permease